MTEPIFTFRNNATGKNHVINDGDVIVLPADMSLEFDVRPIEDRNRIKRVELTCDDHAATDNSRPWRLGPLVLDSGQHLFAATASDANGGTVCRGAVRFSSSGTTPTPPPVNKLTGKGVCCYGSDDLVQANKVLKDCAIDRVRWWMTTTFKGPFDPHVAQQAKAWKLAGVKRVVLTCTPPINSSTIPTVADATGWAKFARIALAGVDAVQIINEANLPKYWPGTIQKAADICGAIADVFAGSGIQVIAPSISENTAKFQELVATGIGSKVAAFDFHAYGVNSADHIARCKTVAAMTDKPIIESEFGLHSGSFSGWRTEIQKTWDGVKPYISELFCYRLIANAQPAGKFGMVDKEWQQNPETYNGWKVLR